MKTVIAAAAIVLMSGAAAYATDDKAKSTADAPASSGNNPASGANTEKMAPGTTGAMQAPSNGVATTPDEVKSQGGMATAPKGTDGERTAPEKK